MLYLNLKPIAHKFLSENCIPIPVCSCCGQDLSFDALLHNFYCDNANCSDSIKARFLYGCQAWGVESPLNDEDFKNLSKKTLYENVVHLMIESNFSAEQSLIHYVQFLGDAFYDSILKPVFSGYATFKDFYKDFKKETFELSVEFLQNILMHRSDDTDTLFVYDAVYVLSTDLYAMESALLLLDDYINPSVSVADVDVIFAAEQIFYTPQSAATNQFYSRTVSTYVDKVKGFAPNLHYNLERI